MEKTSNKPLGIFLTPVLREGPGIQTLRVARAISKKGIDSWLITKSLIKKSIIQKENNLTIIQLRNARIQNLSFIEWLFCTFNLLKNHLKARRIKFVYVTPPGFLLVLGALLSLVFRIPFVVKNGRPTLYRGTTSHFYQHNQYENYPRTVLRKIFLYIQIIFSDKIQLVNKHLLREALNFGINPKKLFLLPNGIEIDRFFPMIKEKKNKNELGVIITYIGRLNNFKGIKNLITAFINMSTNEKCTLSIFGEGPLKNEIMNLDFSKSNNKMIFVHGQKDEEIILKALNNSDIFVLPSFGEGISNALLEAMCLQNACIVSNAPGNVDVINNNENGLVFDLSDPQSLEKALIGLISNPKLRLRLGEKAFETICKKYSIEVISKQLLIQIIQSSNV